MKCRKLKNNQRQQVIYRRDSYEQYLEDMRAAEDIKSYLGQCTKAPDGFTDAVMAKIYRLGKTCADAAGLRLYIAGLYRRLGVSFILASLILIICIFSPGTGLYKPLTKSGLPDGNPVRQTSGIKESLSGMNSNLEGIFGSIQEYIIRFKEGV